MQPQALAPVIKVKGSPLNAYQQNHLEMLRVDRAFGLVGRATMRFHDPKYLMSSSGTFKLGTEVIVLIPGHHADRTSRTIFKGQVTALGIEQVGGGSVELTVTVDEPIHKLTRSSQQQTFLQMSYGDILRKMCTEVNISTQLALGSAALPYTLVTGTGLSFLDDVTRRTNTRWRYDAEDSKLVVEAADLVPSSAAVTLAMPDQLHRFSVRATSLDADEVMVSGWDDKQQQQTTGRSKPAAGSRKESEFVSGSQGRGNTGTAVLRLSGTPPTTTSEAELLAQSRLEEGRAGAMTARGTTDPDGRLDLGAKVAIRGVGPASGNYVLTAVEHLYDQRGFRTSFTAGSHRPTGMVDLLDRRSGDSGFLRHQVVIGKVSNNNDPDKLGRVKVNFPSMSGTSTESTWARTISPDAGNERGFVFVPEINDEVLVAFEHGDTRRPIVLGSLFSANRGLPTKDKTNVSSSGVDHRRITSRSGHIIDLDDTAGKEQILVLHKKGHQVLLGFDKLEVTADNLPMTFSNGTAKIEFATNGDITIEGTNIKLKATGNVDVEGVQVSAKAKGKLAMEGVMVDVKGTGQVGVSSSAILELKGAMVKIN